VESARLVDARRGLGTEFWKFWTGQTVSNIGSWFTYFALPLLVFKLTGSALNLALTMVAEFLPQLLFGLVIGAIVDRVDRKRMMIATDIARAVVVSTIPVVDAFDALTVWWLYGVGFVSATLTIFFDSGQFAAIPNLVSKDKLVVANGRLMASMSGGQVLGPMIAGALVSFMPVATIMYFDAGTFLVSALSIALVSIGFNVESGDARTPTTLRQDIVEGLRYVWNHPVLRNISVMMALVNFVGATTYAQLVLFAKDRLDATDGQVGLLFSAGGAGIVLLSFAAGPLRKRFSFSAVALGALMIDGLMTILFSATTYYPVALVLWALASGFGLMFNINTMSLRQAIVPNHLLGRIMSIASVLAWSAIPLGAYIGGLIIEATGEVALVYGVIGALVFALSAVFSFTALGHADRYIPATEPTEPEPAPAAYLPGPPSA
jgi:MFS family permease